MANLLKTAQTQGNPNITLAGSLDHASAIITKDYLDRLETYKIMPPSVEDLDIDIAECGTFYKLSRLVINRDENFLNKLTTIVNVASSMKCSIATMISSDGSAIDYYFGILSKQARDQTETGIRRRQADAAACKGALLGNLAGSELKELSKAEVNAFRNQTLTKAGNCYASVSGIVALRDADDRRMEGYVQGIENLADSLRGLRYTIVMLADPVSTPEIRVIRQGYELLHTQLSTFARSAVTLHESDTLSLSKARTDGISEGIARGIAMTQSRTRSRGTSSGVHAGAQFGLDLGIKAVVSAGVSMGSSSGTADTLGQTHTTTETSQRSRAVTDTASSARTAGKSFQLNYENRSVKALLDKIDQHLERLDQCESFGAFDCAAYVIADQRETALAVAGNYNALMRGQNSSVQASHINSWFRPEDTAVLGKYINALVHPRFLQNERDRLLVTPASMVSGEELAIQIGLPKKSISGIPVIPMTPFGRNMVESTGETLELGCLYHMGHDEGSRGREQKVRIDMESLSMHTFITGSTGAGKTTTIYSILDKLRPRIKFMVIEPAKGEYKDRFGNDPDVRVYGTNHKKMPLLRINPFSFPDDIHVLEHIDRLIEIFNVCWPMYAAMPAVLKDSIERAYLVAGWNLETSQCRYRDGQGTPLFPSFADVLRQIHQVVDESAYSSDSRGDYKGALCTRLKSLTNGLYGQIFTSEELSGEKLFDSNVIVDLSRTGSGETKALIMGLLVMKLQEYRMANAGGGNAPLRHVTVLEEAHNLLKRTSTEQLSEGSNLLGKSVEMLANAIAEMRTYGEGFLIADQAPGLMDKSVIRNTNTKIILRLPDLEDRELAGRAAGLNDGQILEISRLQNFVAAVYQNNWLEPVLCHVDTNFKRVLPYRYKGTAFTRVEKRPFLEYLLLPVEKRDLLDSRYVAGLVQEVYKLPVSAESKVAFIRYTKARGKEDIQKLRGQVVYDLFNSEAAFGLARSKEGDIKAWYDCMCQILDLDITQLREQDQKKVIAVLAREKAQIEKSTASEDLFERFMDL